MLHILEVRTKTFRQAKSIKHCFFNEICTIQKISTFMLSYNLTMLFECLRDNTKTDYLLFL